MAQQKCDCGPAWAGSDIRAEMACRVEQGLGLAGSRRAGIVGIVHSRPGAGVPVLPQLW